VLLKE